MSTDRDTTRIVRSWLRAEENESADRVLGTVLDRLDTTPQRRATWPAPRLPRINTFARLVASAAVAAATLVGLNYLLAPGAAGPGPGAPSSSSLVPEVSPPLVPALYGQDPLPPGRYQVDPALPMRVTVEVPAGWSAGGNWVVRGPVGPEAPDGMAIRFYTASTIYVDPLVIDEGRVDPRVGPSVDDLVAALVDHSGWTVTGTDPITIGGYDGQVLHVTLPAGTSEETPFYLFAAGGGGVIYVTDPDQVLDIYIVDVAGKRLVIDAFHFPSTSESDLAAKDAVLASIQIEPAP